MTALLALCSSVVWGTSDFAAGLVAKRRPAAAVVGWSQAFGLVVMSTIVLALGTWPPGTWPAGRARRSIRGIQRPDLLLCGVEHRDHGGGCAHRLPRGRGAGPSRRAGREAPSVLSWTGMAIAVVGALLASGPELDGRIGRRPVLLACLAGAGFGSPFMPSTVGGASRWRTHCGVCG